MMRRSRCLVLAACLIGASASGAAAQEPSSAPVEGTRVELPEHGSPTTLPDDWLVICPWSDEALETLSGSRDDGEPLDEQERVIVDRMAAFFAECQFVAITHSGLCLVVAAMARQAAGPSGP